MKNVNDKTLQINIIKRFMTAEAFEAFYNQYKENRKQSGLRAAGEILAPTLEELQVAAMVREIGVAETVKRTGLDHKKIYQYTTKVARHEFLKG